jgi:hypothetical protein
MNSTRLLGLAIAVTALASSVALAAGGTPERLRGTVTAVSASSVTIDTHGGKSVSVALNDKTKYVKVSKSSLDKIDKDSYVGIATKSVGDQNIALEVVVFPAALRGLGEGHYPWDKIEDTTQSGGVRTASAMTNGNVASVKAAPTTVKSAMTNGNVATAKAQGDVLHLVVSYQGGQQDILVPPTAPIVTIGPGTHALVKKGKWILIRATKTDAGLVADGINVGVHGVKPPN